MNLGLILLIITRYILNYYKFLHLININEIKNIVSRDSDICDKKVNILCPCRNLPCYGSTDTI